MLSHRNSCTYFWSDYHTCKVMEGVHEGATVGEESLQDLDFTDIVVLFADTIEILTTLASRM